MSAILIGIDTGGTFTDVVLCDLSSNYYTYFKLPTSTGKPSQAVLDGIKGILELSNLPTYVVYHMLKLEKDVRLVRVFQFIWLCYFRVYIMTNIIINNILDHDSDITILLVCLIYIIGINFNICILKQIYVG